MMKAMGIVMAVLVGCGTEEPPPSCFQAMTAYYGAGCAFQDLDTGQVIPQNQATGDCQSEAGNAPACETQFGGWLACLEATSPAEGCDCSTELMAYLACY